MGTARQWLKGDLIFMLRRSVPGGNYCGRHAQGPDARPQNGNSVITPIIKKRN